MPTSSELEGLKNAAAGYRQQASAGEPGESAALRQLCLAQIKDYTAAAGAAHMAWAG